MSSRLLTYLLKNILNRHFEAWHYITAIKHCVFAENGYVSQRAINGNSAFVRVESQNHGGTGGKPIDGFFFDFGMRVSGRYYFDGKVRCSRPKAFASSNFFNSFLAHERYVWGTNGVGV